MRSTRRQMGYGDIGDAGDVKLGWLAAILLICCVLGLLFSASCALLELYGIMWCQPHFWMSAGWWMVTVVEQRDIVTRLPMKDEGQAKTFRDELRKQKESKGWLTVTLAQVTEPPHRSAEEKSRALKLMYP